MKKRKKIIIWVVIILGLIALMGLFYVYNKKEKVKYETEEVSRQNIVQTIAVTGNILAKKRADLSFEVGGTVTSLKNLKVGDYLKKGECFITLNNRGLYAQLVESRQGVAIEEEREKLMRRHWDDYKPEERKQQKLSVERVRAQSNSVAGQLTKLRLCTPMEGTIAKLNVTRGEVISPGQILATVINSNDFEIEVEVPESDIAQIMVGQKAKVSLDALDDKDLIAQVTEVSQSSTEIQEVVYFKVKLNLDKTDKRLKDGMSADVDILIAEKNNVLAVADQAIKEEAGKKYVEIEKADGQLKKVFIEIGLRGDEGKTEIISGLQVGDRVIIFKKKNK